jgi:hypothetical protein
LYESTKEHFYNLSTRSDLGQSSVQLADSRASLKLSEKNVSSYAFFIGTLRQPKYCGLDFAGRLIEFTKGTLLPTRIGFRTRLLVTFSAFKESQEKNIMEQKLSLV